MLYVVLSFLFILIICQVFIFIYLNRKFNYLFFKIEQSKDSIREENTFFLENDEKNEWKEEVKRTVELQCMTVRNAVHKQTNDLHKKQIELAPRSLTIPMEFLETVYNKSKILILTEFWREYNLYLDSFWLKKNKSIKTVFKGEKDDPTSEINQIMRESEILTKKMNTWLKEILEN
ncbi:hypothetical protein QA612_09130 [Evansella sp. AB-P1]|uniref:hypothetical protein n=1 Tax=Evansella sp. AB-P1 TaxID=3037653 RepID=UPI00241E980D|nr:hypothetical protein [Evansella sp. AB-P1]MDG5787659.1 hypothetical protein [Evansella sp. AB-P1]